ncbi:potassium channel subfamily K member 4 [Lampris incognitus]|uniref:potassium channel subfamily K member 4 n=1 Tax=Lampris incognitus TaxID=2546036 RepID=UPI0024B62B57|nr:potassium channel subfamily K member 4 [Lampris incognitus]
MRCPTLFALLVGVMLYLAVGALVFRNLEAHQERWAYEKLSRIKSTFVHNHSCVSEQGFNDLIQGVVSAVEAGLDVASNSTNFTSHWDLASAFFFCGTIITTIGFGNLSPRTKIGQLFCVCYALVGIPMFGILLAGVGDHMGTVLRRAVAKIETLFLKRKVSPTIVRVISAVLSILIGCLIFLAVPAVVFHEVEEWSFLEALYFVVITLTTVGFGDYVPGVERHTQTHKRFLYFKPLVWLWIVFGLAYFASILTMIGNWLRVLSKRTRAEMEELRAHATDWTQNMSMDFRIPNPLEFNDPFLLQRRRWKRSERRRVRRGAQGTLGYWVRGGSENGYLPNRWAGLSRSTSQLKVYSRNEPDVASEVRARGKCGGKVVVPRAGTHLEIRSFTRSLSLPVTHSASELDSPERVLHGDSFSGSESPFGSRSHALSSTSSFSELHSFQPCQTISDVEQGFQSCVEPQGNVDALTVPGGDIQIQLAEVAVFLVGGESGCTPSTIFLPPSSSSSSPAPAHVPSPQPSPPLPLASSPGCQLLDFFGENLAYIDESSDTLSDRFQPAESKEKKRRPCKPKRRRVRGQLPGRIGPLKARKRLNSNTQPPSNPPTPPPQPTL